MSSQIQPALTGPSSEFWKDGDIRYQLTNGSSIKIDALPVLLVIALSAELKDDLPAQRGLDKLGIVDPDERLLKFFDCNFSSFDRYPDLDINGSLGKREFVKCCERGICPAEGESCRFPNKLSKKEAEVARCIALGYTDAQICYELDIAQDTLRNHKNSIERKINMKGKPAIAAWAVKNKII